MLEVVKEVESGGSCRREGKGKQRRYGYGKSSITVQYSTVLIIAPKSHLVCVQAVCVQSILRISRYSGAERQKMSSYGGE